MSAAGSTPAAVTARGCNNRYNLAATNRYWVGFDLGGGLMEAMPKMFIEAVREAIRKPSMKPFRATKVVVAELSDDAGVLGAAALAADQAS